MPLIDYKIDDLSGVLAPLLEQHAAWYAGTVRGILFPGSGVGVAPPDLSAWLARAEACDGFTSRTAVAAIGRLHGEILKLTLTGAGADKNRLEALDAVHQEFLAVAQKLFHDAAIYDSGLDPLTMLRNRKTMEPELESELERRARQGKPFCLVVARIDAYDAIRAATGEDQAREIVRNVSDLIKKCVRSFDDAYRSGEAEFIMALKHSDATGGIAAITRMKEYLEETPLLADHGDGKPVRVTLSYCAGEPVPGEPVGEFLKNMRADLRRYEGDESTALEYLEQSPLERFLSVDVGKG